MKRADKAIHYQRHAERRMEQRGVSKEQVRKALRDPDVERPAKRDDARLFEKHISRKRRLRVIASEDKTSFWVITAWFQ